MGLGERLIVQYREKEGSSSKRLGRGKKPTAVNCKEEHDIIKQEGVSEDVTMALYQDDSIDDVAILEDTEVVLSTAKTVEIESSSPIPPPTAYEDERLYGKLRRTRRNVRILSQNSPPLIPSPFQLMIQNKLSQESDVVPDIVLHVLGRTCPQGM